LSRLDAAAADASASLARDERGATFAEPWQAQAFALVVSLFAQGHLTWEEWTAALGAELAAAARSGTKDDGSRYHEHWLAALERLVAAKGLVPKSELRESAEAHAHALRDAAHGPPTTRTPLGT
jgi:nitrile hydratase accessory protein